ncbi:MAG: SDR family oxidoreductase [Nanoarchaeota archaeon]|nr:SDR family oxidoreductase [Nanoarchaeota archaeon]
MKTAIITGASRGLGHEIALKLIEKGVKIINLSRTESKLDVINIKTDLSKHEDVVDVINKIKKEHQDFDILILNSGVAHWNKIGEIPIEEIDGDFAINITSSIKLTNGLLSLIKKNKGDIVFIGSTSSFSSFGEDSVYCSTKHAIVGYVKAMQKELKKEEVRIIGYYPGGFKSQLHQESESGLSQDVLMNPKDLAQLLISILEMPRSVQVSEIIVDRKTAGMK